MNWHKQKRSNETHESTTDPLARLYKKTRGAEAKLGYLGHVVTKNRNGLVVDVRLTHATGTAERETAVEMMKQRQTASRVTLGGDRGYDTRGFVAQLRALGVTPHVAQNDSNRRSAIDGRTTRHDGYVVSQRKRKRVEEVWLDQDGRTSAKDPVPGNGSGGLDVHLRCGGIQSGADAESSGSRIGEVGPKWPTKSPSGHL